MELGITMLITAESMSAADLARAAEERGFESLFLPEHTHIPLDTDAKRFPYGTEVPELFRHMVDPFIALASVATVTERLRLGTAVSLAFQRDPIVLAKELATLDVISGGRLVLGVGGGWNREEMSNHGVDPRVRFAVLREKILAMKAIWTADTAEFHGEHVDFGPLWQWPKPIQKPHPPVLLGGWGPSTFERVLDYADGWLPGGGPDLARGIAELQKLAAAQGRARVPITVMGGRPPLQGLVHYRDVGADRCVLWLPTTTADQILPLLDHYAQLAEQLNR